LGVLGRAEICEARKKVGMRLRVGIRCLSHLVLKEKCSKVRKEEEFTWENGENEYDGEIPSNPIPFE
jgi:hypothetical protein